MTRENEIANAALEAMTETLMSTPNYEFSPKATDLLECAYIKGAEWADKHPANPWHSVADGDLPTKDGYYLCRDESDSIIGSFDVKFKVFYDPHSRFDCDKITWIKYWMEIPEIKEKER